jgi:SPP1 family predicted phage head-tail adaptor
MRIGKLRHQVRFEQPANTSDGAGGEVTAWSAIATVWAEILPLGGAKIEEGNSITVGQQRYKLHTRYRTDVTPACRVIWLDGARVIDLRIDSVADMDGRRRFLLLNATDGVPT